MTKIWTTLGRDTLIKSGFLEFRRPIVAKPQDYAT